MLDELREHVRAFLAGHGVGVISSAGPEGVWAMPVLYRASGLDVDVLIPSWADGVFYLEQDPHALLVVMDSAGDRRRWLEYRGTARPVAEPDWQDLLPADQPPSRAHWLYRLFRVQPSRIDLVDESRGWGTRETIECG